MHVRSLSRWCPWPAGPLCGLVLASVFLTTGCVHQEPPVVAFQGAVVDDPVPVVFVPGVLGSKLQDTETGKYIWGRGVNVLWPRDGGYVFALPVSLDERRRESYASAVEAPSVVDEVRLLWVHREVYDQLTDVMEDHGYRGGDLQDPTPDESFFFFAYDWRWSNIRSVRQLADALEKLRLARGEERLRVNLVCQSNGAHICRYLAKYGAVSLEDAEAGRGSPPATLDIERLVLVGTANGGGLRALRELHRGRRYVPPIGRWWRPETLFTLRSIYEELPAYRNDLFLDEHGQPMEIDLFDPQSWVRYGWSIFHPEARKRASDEKLAELFGTEEERVAFLTSTLDRARRFQRLLATDAPGFGDTRYYTIQSPYLPTPERAVLMQVDGEWELLFSGDPELERDHPYLNALASGPGDGHASTASQAYLSPQEQAAMTGVPFHVHTLHHEVSLNHAAHHHMLAILNPAMPPSPRLGTEP